MEKPSPNVADVIQFGLNFHAEQVELVADADFLAVFGPILPALDDRVRAAVEIRRSSTEHGRQKLLVLLETPGGLVEIVERMVRVTRHWYQQVEVIVLNAAMSAGTVFAMSADEIWMDYFSVLGPIDPQCERNGRLVPALAYLLQFEELNNKAAAGQLTSAEYVLLERLDLAELYEFKQARLLSIELLEKWLTSYKFKQWNVTETSRLPVDEAKKRDRAKSIATLLSETNRWHTHGRGIARDTLEEEIGLRIRRLEDEPRLKDECRRYFDLALDFMNREGRESLVHTLFYFEPFAR
jgi:hypothetical protein